MTKILSSRIILVIGVFLGACSSAPEKRVNNAEGPVSARARNALAAENPEGLVEVARGFERTGNLEGAYKLYQQAAAAKPELLSPKLGLSRILSSLGQHREALKILDDAEQLHGSAFELVVTFSETLVQAGRYKEAEEKLGIVKDDIYSDPQRIEFAGRLAQVNNRKMHARSLFDKSLTLFPGRANAHIYLAFSFALEGKYETAVAVLQRVMDSPKGISQGKRALAIVYALSGQKKAALVIASSTTDQGDFENMRFVFELLPRLNQQEKAALLMFDQIPTGYLQGSK